MIDYPNKLNIIFDKLKKLGIKPVLVGGYIRDKLLKLDSKDIDVELYGVDSLKKIEHILCEFGEVNSVGRSFGVCKLSYKGIDLDFSLPREDSKVADGHRGFFIQTYKNLDFKTAASRRDFTINAMGYDLVEKKLLDPFHGKEDLSNGLLKAVSIEKFDEDPLRILRAVGFSSRFEFELDSKLFQLIKYMVSKGALLELPQERIFSEFKKFLLRSKKPSLALKLLKSLHMESFFGVYNAERELDYFATCKTDNERVNLLIFLTLLYDKRDRGDIQRLIREKSLLQTISLFIDVKKSFLLESYSDYDIYLLATKVNIEHFLYYLDASYIGEKKEVILALKERAVNLDVLNCKLPPLIQGKDLINLKLSPSKEFHNILANVYEAQMRQEFTTKKEALKWTEYSSLFVNKKESQSLQDQH